ncbi:sensor histidine kinase [Sphingomonas abietis]|uniref:histidine kinase n=1 Tax=Sphingomonas abietis TaxID=3012344 RepID=A0ABY7NP12_9SPHN|nr:HAMP domain-containing sensor histidine kinase [Sphingomonas abietis]WBO23274.1 HAMP domain-containing sensor histidine kinase [Sphingomonas abietis]
MTARFMLSERLRIQDIRNTSTFRLTIMFGLVFTIGVAVLLGVIYGLSARELTLRSDRILRLEALMLEAAPPGSLPDLIRNEIARSASGQNYFELRSDTGDRVVGNIEVSEDLPLDRPVEIAPGHGLDVPIRLLAVRTRSEETLFVGRDISVVLDLRNRVLTILVGSGLATAIAVLISGILLSLAPLRRVRDMQQASRSIAAGNLDMRMPLMGRGDELDLFAGTVNTMVEEVGRVIAQVKGVTDAIAHDLRTPLTRVRSQLYRAHQVPGIVSPATAMIEAATVDLDIVLDRFAALLRISELEAGSGRAGFGPVDLAHIVASIHDLYEPLADERSIVFEADHARLDQVLGDDKLLFEAVSNLVDNAIKFTPIGGRVGIALRDDGHGPVIEVRDDGPGLAEDEKHAVLRRFHRGAAAVDVPGSGLGLSIVSAIMHLHGFALDFADGEPGLIARLCCHENRGATAEQ